MKSKHLWYLDQDPPLSGILNMAIDRALLERAEKSEVPRTWLRLYRWDVPTVSIGRSQQEAKSVDRGYCHSHHIPIVQRSTGGRAVLHHDELTYAIVSNDPAVFPVEIQDTYLKIAKVLQQSLQEVGVPTELCSRPKVDLSGQGLTETGVGPLPCFMSVTRHELLCRGRKIAGSAQRRLRRSFLQHGSIPLSVDYDSMSRALGTTERLLRRSLTGVNLETSNSVSFMSLGQKITQSMAQLMGGPPNHL